MFKNRSLNLYTLELIFESQTKSSSRFISKGVTTEALILPEHCYTVIYTSDFQQVLFSESNYCACSDFTLLVTFFEELCDFIFPLLQRVAFTLVSSSFAGFLFTISLSKTRELFLQVLAN